MNYWLVKSEPSAYSIDDLERDRTTRWDGVRNFQARNFLRAMKAGDKVVFYASSADPAGVTGLAEVSGEARPEPKDPTWSMVELRFVEKFPATIAIDTLRETRGLESMVILKRGNRLSVTPVTRAEYDIVVKLGHARSSEGRHHEARR